MGDLTDTGLPTLVRVGKPPIGSTGISNLSCENLGHIGTYLRCIKMYYVLLKDTTLYNIIQIGSGFDFVKLEADMS